jgi:gas vesicle protein
MAQECSREDFAWFLAGVGIGALVGVLSAPKSGRETRDELANSAREGSEFIRARARQAADGVTALVGKVKSQANEFPDHLRGFAEG